MKSNATAAASGSNETEQEEHEQELLSGGLLIAFQFFTAGKWKLFQKDRQDLSRVKTVPRDFLANSCGVEGSCDLSCLLLLSPSSVRIQDCFFFSCPNLVKLIFTSPPSSSSSSSSSSSASMTGIVSLGKYAFAQCSSLEEISLEAFKDLEILQDGFLSDCPSLKQVDFSVLPKLKKICRNCCHRAVDLKEINLKNLRQLEEVGEYFLSETSIQKADLSHLTSLHSVGSNFLSNNCLLDEIDFSNVRKLREVGCRFLFQNMNLTSLDLSSCFGTLENLGSDFCVSCSNLQKIKFYPSAAANAGCCPSSSMRRIGANFMTETDLKYFDFTLFMDSYLIGENILFFADPAKNAAIELIGFHKLGNVSEIRDPALKSRVGEAISRAQSRQKIAAMVSLIAYYGGGGAGGGGNKISQLMREVYNTRVLVIKFILPKWKNFVL